MYNHLGHVIWPVTSICHRPSRGVGHRGSDTQCGLCVSLVSAIPYAGAVHGGVDGAIAASRPGTRVERFDKQCKSRAVVGDDCRSQIQIQHTPLQLARSFLGDSVQASKSHKIKSVVPAANHTFGCSPSSGASMSQDASQASTPQDTGKWYSIKSAAKEKHACKCAGNCRSGCPGRAYACPNNATNNIHFIGKRWRPLCVACCCKHPSCPAGARRPWGKRLKDANYGFCQSHWT